jgi:DNA polymerase-3 subunit delta'
MTFSTIVGHEQSIRTLQRAIANKALAHAYLFSGQEGIGKKKTALALAAAVNCPNAKPEGGCGVCPSCRRIVALTHADVHIVMPESENEQLLATWSTKEVEKASDEIKIDQIRQAQERLSLTPSEGAKKILIVDGAETLNVSAQNAFLKTLEEPPGDALIILITAMPQSLLPTIRSRCQEITFHPLPRNTLARALAQRREFSEEDAWFIAALAQGSMGRGLEMDVEQEKTTRDEVATLWTGLGQMGPGETLSLAEALAKDRERLERLIEIGIEALRDTLVYRETGEERLLVHARAQQLYRQIADQYSSPRLLADMELFKASRDLLDRRVSAQLVAENLLLKFGRG